MPSWLLGDAATAAWHMRAQHGADAFGVWLRQALAPEGAPRRGLTAEHKRAFEAQLMGAANWSAFKAALKQLCGGKKKQH